jgi:hypothetical protein
MALIKVPRGVYPKYSEPDGKLAVAGVREHESKYVRADPTPLILRDNIELIQL